MINFSAWKILTNLALNVAMAALCGLALSYSMIGDRPYNIGPASYIAMILFSAIGTVFFLASGICPIVGYIKRGGLFIEVSSAFRVNRCRTACFKPQDIVDLRYTNDPSWLGASVELRFRSGKTVKIPTSLASTTPQETTRILRQSLGLEAGPSLGA